MDPLSHSTNRFLSRPDGLTIQKAPRLRGGQLETGRTEKLSAASDKDSRFIFELEFVDRQYEAEIIGRNLLSNQERILSGTSVKPLFTTTGQLYGAGKTMMGRYATKCIDMYPEVRARLEKYNAKKHSGKFGGKGLLDAYLSSIYVHVPLNTLLPSGFDNFWKGLAFALFCAILVVVDPTCTTHSNAVRKLFHDLKLKSFLDVVRYFQDRMPGQTFFLHFDEVGIIESDYHVENTNWPAHGGDLILRLERYYDFWSVLCQLLTTEGIYVYATDKKPAFAMIGLGLLSDRKPSPTMHESVFLGSFGPAEIVKTFLKSRNSDGELLTDHVQVAPDMLDEFGRQIYQCTAGVPQLTCGALQMLCSLQQDPLHLRSPGEINSALQVCYQRLVRDSNFWFSTLGRSKDLSGAYLGLMVLAMLKQPIGIDTKIQLPNLGRTLDILQLADRLDVFFEYAEGPNGAPDKDRVVVKFSGWNLQFLTKRVKAMDRRLPSIAPLVPMAEVLVYGAPFEWLLMVILLSVFALAARGPGKTWSAVFPVFSDTCVANMKFFMDATVPVSLIPGVSAKKLLLLTAAEWRALKAAPSSAWSCQMRPEDWKNCFEYLIQPSSLIHPAPKSASPDLLFIGMPSEEGLIAWALKLTDVKNPVNWSIIQAEIIKAKPLLLVKKVCLVVTCLYLAKEILDTLSVVGSSCLLVTQGAWVFSNIEGKLVRSDDQSKSLDIPVGLEVLILGPQAVEEIFGESNVEQLKILVKERREPNWPSLLLNALSANNLEQSSQN